MRLALLALIGAGALAGCNRPAPPRAAPATAAAMPMPVPVQQQVFQVPPPPPEPDEGPLPVELRQEAIPQDRDRMTKLRAERLARARASTIEAYAKVGTRSEKWDRVAEDGLTRLAALMAGDYQDPDGLEAAFAALGAAVRAGCDDPLVRYMYLRLLERRSPGRKEERELQVDTARPLRDSNYPAIRRAHAAHNLAVHLLRSPGTPEAVEAALAHPDFVRVRELLKEAWADDPRGTAEAIVEIAALTQDYCTMVRGGREPPYRAFAELVEDLPGAKGLDLWLRGRYLLDLAYDIRGYGWTTGTSPAGDRAFHRRLEEAAEVLEEAWQVDPTRPEVAVALMRAAGPREDFEELEYWFRRAMTVDGDSVAACREKGQFLSPRRGGHTEAVRQFAARLADTKNFHARLPLLGVQFVSRLHSQPDPANARVHDADWPLVERVFTDALAAHPDSRWTATRLLWYGWLNQRYAVAMKAADRLDGKPFERLMEQKQYDSIRDYCRQSVAAGHR